MDANASILTMEAPRLGSLEMVTYASAHGPAEDRMKPARCAAAIEHAKRAAKATTVGRTDDVTPEFLRSALRRR